ncbi:MAG: caspase family protein, partial [Pseudomonadota bacterium]
MTKAFLRLILAAASMTLLATQAASAMGGAGGAPVEGEARLALIISQSDYSDSMGALLGTPEEADLIHSALDQTGFNVWRESDLTATQLKDTLREFRRELDGLGPDAVGFIYYTGHGAQHPETEASYLLGIDADIEVASDLNEFGVDLGAQRDNFAAVGAKAVFMVFDACRNVPGFGGFKTSMKGLNRVEAQSDMLIAYSTDLGDVAAEGEYAPVLAEELIRAGQSAETAFSNAQRRVAEQTDRRQLPWYNPRLYNTVCFAGCQPVNSAPPPSLPDVPEGPPEAPQQVVMTEPVTRDPAEEEMTARERRALELEREKALEEKRREADAAAAVAASISLMRASASPLQTRPNCVSQSSLVETFA